jgi:hypothetical protein
VNRRRRRNGRASNYPHLQNYDAPGHCSSLSSDAHAPRPSVSTLVFKLGPQRGIASCVPSIPIQGPAEMRVEGRDAKNRTRNVFQHAAERSYAIFLLFHTMESMAVRRSPISGELRAEVEHETCHGLLVRRRSLASAIPHPPNISFFAKNSPFFPSSNLTLILIAVICTLQDQRAAFFLWRNQTTCTSFLEFKLRPSGLFLNVRHIITIYLP